MPQPANYLPLEADWVERPLAVTVEGRTITGTARANWGDVEVTLTSPVGNLTRTHHRRSWSFAGMALHWPETRYACRGELTPRGRETAERLLAELYQDWLAAARHAAAVEAACRHTRGELEQLARDAAARAEPMRPQRRALRLLFKAGGLSQQEYQRRIKALGKRLEEVERARQQAAWGVEQRLGVRLQGICGRNLSLEEAERLLTDVPIVVEVPPSSP